MCEKITNVPALFGQMVFGEQQMQQRLPADIYQKWQQCLAQGTPLDRSTAGEIANAMKDWALEKGATHYTHWFQPMTGFTAEKHDSFITRDGKDGVVMELSAKELSKGEADASSFPSGGLRATFEARGYTAWDPTSYAFVKDGTLCIPTAFCSYNGQILDKKTPLLRSMDALSREAVRVLALLGRPVRRVDATVGPEQEYFLVDRAAYARRPDLVLTGRTLLGARPPRGQELDDHYFGTLRPRVKAFMAELDEELWKLGIPATTQHNEVAPAQHEMAPIYTMCNLAVDQNQLTMETMKRVATRHGLVCLLHEKPYAGVNGSGKHNNWSIGTDTGENLLDPGDTPNENLQFLLVLSCIMKAVDTHADLLRQSASCVGNEHRLGGQEAPPAIISIFLGDQLESVVDQIISNAESVKLLASGKLDSGVSTVPVLNKDATDRNRTTPFAFTGNKFEFRMVGSSDSIADANTTLNAIVAEALCEAADQLEQAGDFNAACTKLIHDNMAQHQRIIFNGDGYSDEWVAEAARRGLPNLASLVDAVPALTTEKAVKLFTKFGIYTQSELEARADIMYETYVKTIKIEANTMIHMAAKHYIPTVIGYTTRLAQSITAVASACPEAELSVQRGLLKDVSARLAEASAALEQLKPLMDRVDAIQDVKEMAIAYRTAVVPAMDALRYPIDQLELMVDKSIWPVPTYGDLMFEV